MSMTGTATRRRVSGLPLDFDLFLLAFLISQVLGVMLGALALEVWW